MHNGIDINDLLPSSASCFCPFQCVCSEMDALMESQLDTIGSRCPIEKRQFVTEAHKYTKIPIINYMLGKK